MLERSGNPARVAGACVYDTRYLLFSISLYQFKILDFLTTWKRNKWDSVVPGGAWDIIGITSPGK